MTRLSYEGFVALNKFAVMRDTRPMLVHLCNLTAGKLMEVLSTAKF